LTKKSAGKTAAVLISGGGSNLQSFIDATRNGKLDFEISVVVSNRSDAFGLERARNAGIDVECLRHQDFPERTQFDAALVQMLEGYDPDIIILAGFMRILSAVFVDRYAGRILNIHPSLLPRHAGLDTHQRAIDARDEWHGCTVHFVTRELDGGPPIIQARVPVRDNDTAESLAARVLKFEHRIYPEAAALLSSGRLLYRDGYAWLDGQRLDKPVQYVG
jgi:phosphoribosylglycinamide formyltransferase-1